MATLPRIVSLAPSNTEIVHALGLMEQLVGVDDWSDWPEAVNQLPRVGPDLSVDLDRVAALKPDLVLASLSVPGMERNVEGLRQRGLPHIVLDPKGIAEIWANLRLVGEHCGVPDRAEAVIAGLQERVAVVQRRAAGRPAGARPDPAGLDRREAARSRPRLQAPRLGCAGGGAAGPGPRDGGGALQPALAPANRRSGAPERLARQIRRFSSQGKGLALRLANSGSNSKFPKRKRGDQHALAPGSSLRFEPDAAANHAGQAAENELPHDRRGA